MEKKYNCLCCGYKTIGMRGEFDICPVCFSEDDAYFDFSEMIPSEEKDGVPIVKSIYCDNEIEMEELLDLPSASNHGLTLREGRRNYKEFGACDRDMLPHVRKPEKDEIPLLFT